MIKAVLLDIAGVLYDSGEPLAGARESLQELRRQPVAIRFVTNTSQQSPGQVAAQLQRMGFEMAAEELYTAPGAVAAYLEERGSGCYTLVHPNLDELFRPFLSDSPDAVVVADAGDRFDYNHLNRAFEFLMQGASLIAIGDNRYFSRDGELLLDAGPFIHALGYAADKEPVVIGKPSATFFEVVLNSVPCAPEEALMIGDDVAADCEGALRAGLSACLVQTGKYRPGDEARCGLSGLRCERDLGRALQAFELI